MNYYNDFDPNAAATLRELIARGLIANGIVDDRSILDVEPSDLRGFTQCHFFAGAGVWSYALRLAGWPDHWPVWTGSPPCQPFSVAGKQDGKDDARHLSPKFAGLVRACSPPLLFGEQVASTAVFGPSAKGNRPGFEGTPPWAWLDDLFDRLEAAHYAVGANDVPNAGVGAPHIRQRTYFAAIRLANLHSNGRDQGRKRVPETRDDGPFGDGSFGWMADGLGEGLEGYGGNGNDRDQSGRVGANQVGPASPGCEFDQLDDGGRPGPVNGFWADADWLFCRDGKWRPTQPGLQPLAHGSPARVGRLRLYGNAINPWPAKAYIEAFCEAAGIPLPGNGLASSGLNSHF